MLLSGAMMLSMGFPVMGEEAGIADEMDVQEAGIPEADIQEAEDPETDVTENDETAGYEYEGEPGAGAETYSYGFNYSASANTYRGTIFVKDDGLYDALSGGNLVNHKGLTYEPSTHTLTMENVNIGEVYDGPLSHEHSGSLMFCGEGGVEKSRK